MVQSEVYAGGFDATEKAFCFSYYEPDGSEYWFQVTLCEIKDISEGKLKEVSARPSE